mmetsp:Transcript_298/g.1269  ORF Transcript_298/g.1269 Transcript_298/m.1269 type:complete len:275 (+) Transcript_298:1067-1891(+)
MASHVRVSSRGGDESLGARGDGGGEALLGSPDHGGRAPGSRSEETDGAVFGRRHQHPRARPAFVSPEELEVDNLLAQFHDLRGVSAGGDARSFRAGPHAAASLGRGVTGGGHDQRGTRVRRGRRHLERPRLPGRGHRRRHEDSVADVADSRRVGDWHRRPVVCGVVHDDEPVLVHHGRSDGRLHGPRDARAHGREGREGRCRARARRRGGGGGGERIHRHHRHRRLPGLEHHLRGGGDGVDDLAGAREGQVHVHHPRRRRRHRGRSGSDSGRDG